MERLQDHLWIWGHDAGCHHLPKFAEWKIPGTNQMGPAEGAALLGIDYSAWLKAADVITFWSWNSRELAQAENNLLRIIGMTPGKQHYAGCYLYNYGDCREITDSEMEFQLDLYLKFWKQKKIDGIIVCSNTIADTGVHTVDIFRQWNIDHGNELR